MTDNISSTAEPDAIALLYKQLPISSKCIRLLRIYAHEESLGNEAPLRCQLSVADLESGPEYAALTLSYVWGPFASPPQHVYCGDVAIPITTNCYSVLRHLRSTNGTLNIWIDAVCINQEDVNDKMQRIGIMGDIYSKAQKTYVWLGEGTATTDRVMRYLKRVGFLEQYYQDGQSMQQRLEVEEPRVWAAFWTYYKSMWGFGRSTIPYSAGTILEVDGYNLI